MIIRLKFTQSKNYNGEFLIRRKQKSNPVLSCFGVSILYYVALRLAFSHSRSQQISYLKFPSDLK